MELSLVVRAVVQVQVQVYTTGSAETSIEVLKAHIVPNSEMVLEWDSDVMISAYVNAFQTVDWDVMPSGGQEPYSFSWSFSPDDDGLAAITASGDSPLLHVPAYQGAWTATCTVTDATGSQVVATFPFTVNTGWKPSHRLVVVLGQSPWTDAYPGPPI